MKTALVFSSLAAALALLTACGGRSADRPTAQNGGRIYAVAAEAAPFYRFGPQQGNGPDRTLPRDTLVKLIRPSFGYSKVQLLEDKQQGYVASDDIRIAPASLVASANATPAPAADANVALGEQFDLNSHDPRLNAPPEQLPPPDLPPPSDNPTPAPSPAQQ